MSKYTKKQKVAVALGAGAIAIAGGGVALAYWTQSGIGTGSASTGDTVAVTVHQTSTISGLYPGGPPVVLSGNFNNTNSGPVTVGTVTGVLDSTLPSGCVAADFTVTGSAPVNAEIASGSGVGAWSGVTIQMNNTAANQDACRNKTVTVDYAVTAGS
jgi:hypothetical protein